MWHLRDVVMIITAPAAVSRRGDGCGRGVHPAAVVLPQRLPVDALATGHVDVAATSGRTLGRAFHRAVWARAAQATQQPAQPALA